MLYIVESKSSKYFIFDSDDFTIESTSLRNMYAMLKAGICIENLLGIENPDILLSYRFTRRNYLIEECQCYDSKIEYSAPIGLFNDRSNYYICKKYGIITMPVDQYKLVVFVYINGMMYEYITDENYMFRVNGKKYSRPLYTVEFCGYEKDYDSVVMGFSDRVLEFTDSGCYMYKSILRLGSKVHIADGIKIDVNRFRSIAERRAVLRG